jgi:hypothetical protein
MPRIFEVIATLLALTSCSSGPRPQTSTLAYAKLNNEHFFENDMNTTWKAVQEVFSPFKLTSQSTDDARVHKLETDWFETQANDRYETIVIDKIQHQMPLQSRLKFSVVAKTLFNGTQVTVKTSEEIEKLHDDGTHAGFSPVSAPDPLRAATILDNISRALTSRPAQSPSQ